MKHYVYMIINMINEKFYIGKHSSKNPENDGYYGSGVAIKNAVKKHGKENFDKLILSFHTTSDEAYAEEARLVTAEYLLKYKGITYNRELGGKGFANDTMTVVNLDGHTMRLPKDDPRI